jgi:RNA polymerase sigma factor (sigma-70 family)
MDAASATLIPRDAPFRQKAHVMEQSELERELERLHSESWAWALACCSRDRELAEDVLQTAYLRVVSGRATFGGHSSVRTWMFGVIRLVAMEEVRRRTTRRAHHAGAESATGIADPAPGPDMIAERSEQRRLLLAALSGLSARQREVLQLVFYHGMTIEEAARVMTVSLGSARTHYKRGKEALARLLDRELAL